MARMAFRILLAPEAAADLQRLPRAIRAETRTAMQTHLRHAPRKASAGRIKRLRGVSKPQHRLKVGDVRIFYDVTGAFVATLAVVRKSEAARWLARIGSGG